MNESAHNQKIIKWLYSVIGMVMCMVIIGAITRLTDSGLSMVEWRPITGILPPLSDSEWTRVFNIYKDYPEFQKVNFEMTMSEFKMIFFWEYFHRLWGRLIGLVFIIPFFYLAYKKYISKKLYPRLIIALILGGSQGLMGWYMVKSGLVSNPDVSHFRLCAHLILAFSIVSYLYFLTLELTFPKRAFIKDGPLKKTISFFVVILVLQIIYGAFVAGLDAGLTHNNFPKMGRLWVPDGVSFGGILNGDIFSSKVFVQFMHRFFGWILLFLGFLIFLQKNKIQDFSLRKSLTFLSVGVLLQFSIGVATLLYYVPLTLGALHQFGALILVILATRTLFFTFSGLPQKSINSL